MEQLVGMEELMREFFVRKETNYNAIIKKLSDKISQQEAELMILNAKGNKYAEEYAHLLAQLFGMDDVYVSSCLNSGDLLFMASKLGKDELDNIDRKLALLAKNMGLKYTPHVYPTLLSPCADQELALIITDQFGKYYGARHDINYPVLRTVMTHLKSL